MPAYVPTTWINGSTNALNATNLNKLEQGVYYIDTTFQPYALTDSIGNPLASTVDLNTNILTGTFLYTTGAANTPSAGVGIVQVYRRLATQIFQIVTEAASGEMYKRHSTDTGGTWSAWTSLGGVSGLTANRAVVTNASGDLIASANVTDTEIGYLDGVTSAIQTQLNGKMSGLKTISASAPSGGADGDVWYVV